MRTPRFFPIVPAAGRGRRMGCAKLLLPVAGRPMMVWCLDAWRRAGCRPTVVVRRDDAELAECCRRAGGDVVQPEVDPPDMKASVQVALDHLAATRRPLADDYWMLAPADAAGLAAAAIAAVIAACCEHRPPAARADYGTGRGRHPIAVQWKLAEGLARLGPDQGVKHLLQRCPVLEVDCRGWSPPADIDTPQDYLRLAGANPEALSNAEAPAIQDSNRP